MPMNRISVVLMVGLTLGISWTAGNSARAQSGTTDKTPARKKIERPANLNNASDYLKDHASDALGARGNPGGGQGAKYTDPLSENRDDPNTYANKRHPTPSTAPRKRQTPSRPQVMVPAPALRARRDRSFANGVTPQSKIYGGPEGSRYARETDPRAALARAARLAKPKSKLPTVRRPTKTPPTISSRRVPF